MSDINLLPKKEGMQLENDQAAIILRRISLGMLIITGVTAIVLFILVFQSPLSRTRQEENALLSQIDRFKTQVSRNVIINERLGSITNLLTQRSQFVTYISTILQSVPSAVTISSLGLTEKTMELTGNSRSLTANNEFLNSLVAMQKEKKLIKSVVLQSFSSQQESGKYYFTAKIEFL